MNDWMSELEIATERHRLRTLAAMFMGGIVFARLNNSTWSDPLDCEAEVVMLSMCKKALALLNAGRFEEYRRIKREMTIYSQVCEFQT